MKVQQGTTEQKKKHAKKRAMERHDLTLNRQDMAEIRDQIDKSKAICVSRQSIDRAKFYLIFKDKEIVVVYSKRHKTIVTVLPSGCPEEEMGRKVIEDRKRWADERAKKESQKVLDPTKAVR